MKKTERTTVAYVDGQNLIMGVRQEPGSWDIDLGRFRRYLCEKYGVARAYYFLGYRRKEYTKMYKYIRDSGFEIVFKDHSFEMVGKKKGNVDSDIILHIMKLLYQDHTIDFLLVSGDGDFKPLVEFLIQEGRFIKVLFPNGKFASSLYKKIRGRYFASLDEPSILKKLRKIKRGP